MDNKLSGQLQKWHNECENQKIIDRILELPEEQRDYDLIGLLARAYNNNDEYDKAIGQLLSVKEQGENDSLWCFRLAYAYFYKNENERALELFERCKELNPQEPDVDRFITLIKQYIPKYIEGNEENNEKTYAEYWELHLEKAKVPADKNGFFDNDLSPAFSLDISNTGKGLCYECALGLSYDESDNMKQLNLLVSQKGYVANGYGWEAYFNGFFAENTPSLSEKIGRSSEYDTCCFYVYNRDDFYTLLEVISTAVRSLYTVTPPKEKPEIEYLTDMYNDDYYPDFLVDKIKAELSDVVDFIMSGEHTYEEIQLKFDACVKAINELEEDFDKNDSEIETIARESIGATVQTILDSFGIDIDIETAIRERDW